MFFCFFLSASAILVLFHRWDEKKANEKQKAFYCAPKYSAWGYNIIPAYGTEFKLGFPERGSVGEIGTVLRLHIYASATTHQPNVYTCAMSNFRKDKLQMRISEAGAASDS